MKHALVALCLALVACATDKDPIETPNVGCGDFVEGTTREHYGMEKAQFCDERDGRVYVYVVIGEQTWMAENLAYKIKESICAVNTKDGCERYGRFYTDLETAKSVCPSGWHLPSIEEWQVLLDFAAVKFYYDSGKLMAAGECGDYMECTDDYGFAVLLGGFGSTESNAIGHVGIFGSINGECLSFYDFPFESGLRFGKYCQGFPNIRCLKGN